MNTFFQNLKRQRAGRPISARVLNRPMEMLEKFARFSVAPPLEMTNLAGVPCIRLGAVVTIAIALATGTISARVSSTPGSGPISFVTFDGTSLATASGAGTTVYNFSSSGGVATGKYMIVVKIFGYWWIVAQECP